MNERESPFEFTFPEAVAAIERARETRHWPIAQRREAFGDDWPRETANITTAADAATEWLVESLQTLRDAWNAHFATCTTPLLDVPAPTMEQMGTIPFTQGWCRGESRCPASQETAMSADGSWRSSLSRSTRKPHSAGRGGRPRP